MADLFPAYMLTKTILAILTIVGGLSLVFFGLPQPTAEVFSTALITGAGGALVLGPWWRNTARTFKVGLLLCSIGALAGVALIVDSLSREATRDLLILHVVHFGTIVALAVILLHRVHGGRS